jgi:hypothetical protein
MKDAGSLEGVFGTRGNTAYMLMTKKRDHWVQRVDGTNVAWEKALGLEKDGHDLELQKIMLTAENILVFAYYVDKKQDEKTLYVAIHDLENFSLVKGFTPVASIPFTKAKDSGAFGTYRSPDGTKVLVQVFAPDGDAAPTGIHTEVYDANMESLWTQEIDPSSAYGTSTESKWLDDDGSILVLGVKYAEKHEQRQLKRANKVYYTYHLLVYRKGSSTPEDYPIEVADKFLQDMTLAVGKTGDIICGGLYGNKNSFNVRGAFYLRLDRATKAIVHQSYKEFSDEFITSYMTEKEAKKAERKAERKDEELELPEFDLHDIVRRDDGGAVLLAEQYKVVEVTTYTTDANGRTTMRTNYHYYYNDAIVVNIDPEGNIEWAAKVPKRQHSVNDQGLYSSFALGVKGSNIYMVFNDTGENLFLRPGDKVKQFELTGKDALVVLATINKDGEVSREALFSPERREAILRPLDCVQLEDDSMFIYASRRKDFRFGAMTFE